MNTSCLASHNSPTVRPVGNTVNFMDLNCYTLAAQGILENTLRLSLTHLVKLKSCIIGSGLSANMMTSVSLPVDFKNPCTEKLPRTARVISNRYSCLNNMATFSKQNAHKNGRNSAERMDDEPKLFWNLHKVLIFI